MYLDVFSDNPFATNCWLAATDGSDDAVVVDPGFAPERVWEMLGAGGKRPLAVPAPHRPPLHTRAADGLALTEAEAWGSGFPAPAVPVEIVREVFDGELLELAGLRIQVLHTPGHTPGSVCFPTDGIVVSGDLVFAGSIGRSDFPNSSPQHIPPNLQ